MPNKISGLIITYNEEKNIENSIKSLQKVCDEIIIIDSNSEDKTVEIAQKLNAKVIKQNFLGDGPQRNFGLQFCKNSWVINLDADEILDNDAINEIKNLNLDTTSYDAFEFKRKNYVNKEWIKIAGWYPDYVRRLFNKEKTKFSNLQVHTKIETPNYYQLNSHIIHFAYDNYHQIIDKLNKYTTQQITAMNTIKKISYLSPFIHGIGAFIKFYFLKKGFLGGFNGIHLSIIKAFGSYIKYVKILEKNRKNEN